MINRGLTLGQTVYFKTRCFLYRTLKYTAEYHKGAFAKKCQLKNKEQGNTRIEKT